MAGSLSSPDYLNVEVKSLLARHIDDISNDSLIKIVRQLDFWKAEELPEVELLSLTERLIRAATWEKRWSAHDNSSKPFRVPKVRYGKTELLIPIITCGCMRFQHTWLPDNIPLLSNRSNSTKTPSQANIVEVVRKCLKLGINHFETARMYGTSEFQLVTALSFLINSGEIKREDFILQTKIVVSGNIQDFRSKFQESWETLKKLGYIDLFSFHVIGKPDSAEKVLSDDRDGFMSAALEWKKEGKIKHIGFSTHGTAEIIMKLINSNKFEFVNLHYHYFGSYHAEGTPNPMGGHGNLACVKRALELDMGVFCISPVDKGGHLYAPSAVVARTIGPKITPIAFAAFHLWEDAKMHTCSVGFGRPEDLNEIFEAAEIFEKKDKEFLEDFKGAKIRLKERAESKLGKDWYEKSLVNLPCCFTETTSGVSLGHILWCYNLLTAFGMYDMAKARYKSLEDSNKWNHKKSFSENIKMMIDGNPGRCYDPQVDLTNALSKHFDPKSALLSIEKCHDLLQKSSKYTKEQRRDLGWNEAYDLRPWPEFPDFSSVSGVILQNLSRGWFGAGGGPTTESIRNGKELRNSFSSP